MNKKVAVFCTVLALLLLGAVGYILYNLMDDSDSQVVAFDSRTDALYAIPSDAILIYGLESLSDAETLFSDSASDFSNFYDILSPLCGGWDAVFSLHYSSKNKVSPLVVVSIPKTADKDALKNTLQKKCLGISEKRYDGNIIYRSDVPSVSYVVYGNYLIASTSLVITESSVRHLEGKRSIMDNRLFIDATKIIGGRSTLFINYENIGKFFSGCINRPYVPLASFFSKFADWSVFSVENDGTCSSGTGRVLDSVDEDDFSTILLSSGKGVQSKVTDVLPYNTDYVVTLPIKDLKKYMEGYDSFLTANKKASGYDYMRTMAARNSGRQNSPDEWITKLGVSEVAKASVIGNHGKEDVLLLKVSHLDAMENYLEDVNEYLFSGYVASVFGKFFSVPSEEAYCVSSDWVIIGGKEIITQFYAAVSNVNYFNFTDYLSQTPASDITEGQTSLSVIVNLTSMRDSLPAYFKAEYAQPMLKKIDACNCNILTAKALNESGKLSLNFALYNEDLAEQPKPLHESDAADGVLQVDDNTPVEIPSGPFEIKDFRTGKKNYLAQGANNSIRLLNEKKQGVWTVPFSTPLCGYVEQIDYLQNGKLQMLFASGSKLYLMDRLGRFVSPYPVDTQNEIVLGPRVYDFGNDKQYTLVVLHKDNRISMYDRTGKKLTYWNDVVPNEKIKSLPELLMVDGIRYWILRTSFQTIIYNKEGLPIADFSKKRRLKRDTPVDKISSSEVKVITVEGKEVTLNLKTGAFSKN